MCLSISVRLIQAKGLVNVQKQKSSFAYDMILNQECFFFWNLSHIFFSSCLHDPVGPLISFSHFIPVFTGYDLKFRC